MSAQEAPGGSGQEPAPLGAGGRTSLRTRLEARGIRFNLFYLHYYGRRDGGEPDTPGVGRQSGSVDLFGQFNLERMDVVRGGEALVHVKGTWGRNVNPLIGALGDPIDDADGDKRPYVHQLWYQHSSPGRVLQVRAGYLDQQAILDRNAFANSEDRQFMSTFLDNNNAIVPLAVGPGVALFYNAAEWLSVVVAASDARARPRALSFATAFDGEYFLYAEADVSVRLDAAHGPLAGNYRAGVFVDPRDQIEYDTGRTDRRNEGFYLSVDQVLYGEPTGDDQGLGVFARYGWRPANVNRVAHFWSGGAQYQGLLPGRERDTLGVGLYSAIGSDRYRAHVDSTFDRETAYEAYYALQLGPVLALTPAVQLVRQPGGLTTRDDVLLFAVRGRISL